MEVIIGISLILAGVAFIMLRAFLRAKKKPRLPIPPESGSGWTNTAIRRHGDSGKGIR